MQGTLSPTQLSGMSSQMGGGSTVFPTVSNAPTGKLSQQQLQQMSVGMKSSSPSAVSKSTPTDSWASYDSAISNASSPNPHAYQPPGVARSEDPNNPINKVLTSYRQGIGSDYMSAAKSIVNPSSSNPISAGLNISSKVSNAVVSPFTRALSPVLQPIFDKIGHAITNNPKAVQVLNTVNDLIDKHPQAATDLGNLANTIFNVAGLVLGNEASLPETSPASSYVDRIGATTKGAMNDPEFGQTGGGLQSAIKSIQSDITANKDAAGFTPESISKINALDPTKYSSIDNFINDAKSATTPTVNMGEPAMLIAPKISVPKASSDISGSTNPILSQAIKDATPSYSKSMIGEPAVKTAMGETVPRVQEGGGLIKGRQITSTHLETEAGTELSKVKGYNPNGTSLEKYNSIQPELKARAQALSKSLADENILRPPKEIVKVVDSAVKNVSKESLLLSKTDPVIKNYMRVVRNAVAQNDGTLAGELKVRQTIDSAYMNARGKMAFGSDKVAPLDELHSAGRDALNQDIIDHAQSTDVKASLRSQWNLNRAAEVLRDKAEIEGNSTIERLMKAHPTATKVVKAVGRAAGLGEVLHVAAP